MSRVESATRRKNGQSPLFLHCNINSQFAFVLRLFFLMLLHMIDIQADTQTDEKTAKKIGRQTNEMTDKQNDRHADRQTDRQGEG
jgi:hypothetical protein